MTDRDEELRATLKNWKTPLPSAELDTRVWSEFNRSRPPRRSWFAVAAGVLLLAGAAVWLHTGPKQRRPVSIETRVDAAGFRAVPNGAITVIEAGGNR